MKSSPENPFLFIIEDDVVALKNNKRIGDHGFYDDPKVKMWYQRREYDLPRQMPQHEIPPAKTLFLAVFEMYCKTAMTRGDLDNAYTSMQEFLQPKDPRDKEKGILGIVSDDKYIQCFYAERLPLNAQVRQTTGLLWCWEYESTSRGYEQINRWAQHRQHHLDQRYKTQTNALAEFDF